MTTTASTPAPSSPGRSYDQEARLLGELLRSSRLSLLFAEPGTDKTALIQQALLPLLSRRASDRLAAPATRSAGVVVPFPDRRGRAGGRAANRRREIVVYFDRWGEEPLAALRDCLYVAAAAVPVDAPPVRLAQTLADLSERLDARFTVLFDRFEELLMAPAHGAEIAQFASELAEAVARPDLSANFLIALAEEARPRLASLRARIHGFDDYSLRLTTPRDFIPAPADLPGGQPSTPFTIGALPVLSEALPVTAVGTAIAPPRKHKVKRPAPERVPVKTEDVYAMIEECLLRIAAPADVAAADADVLAPHARPRPLSPTATHAEYLQQAITRMEERLWGRLHPRKSP